MGHVIQIDEARIRDHLGEMVRGDVERALLDAEADRLCGAGRYERTQGRQDTGAGCYERSLPTAASEVNHKIPMNVRKILDTTAPTDRTRSHLAPTKPMTPKISSTNCAR
jgi:putative transposase